MPIVYCEAPLRAIRERNADRRRPVPAHVVEHLVDRLDVPDETEAQSVEYALTPTSEGRPRAS